MATKITKKPAAKRPAAKKTTTRKKAPKAQVEIQEELPSDDPIDDDSVELLDDSAIIPDLDSLPSEEELIPEDPEPPVTQAKPGGLYLNNKELLPEIKACKAKGQMSNKLIRMLQLLCSRLARKGSFVNYSYNEDMQAYAMMMLVRTWAAFNPEKSSNPFAFYTQCIKNSFVQYLKHEDRQQRVRDVTMIRQGLNPSYGYDDGHKRGIEDEQDFDTMRTQVEVQTRERFIDAPIERDEKGHEIETVVNPTDDEESEPNLSYVQ